MPKDVLITPGSGLIDFKDTGGASDATIQLNDSGDLIISNPAGNISLGNTAAHVYIGDGTSSVDIIFEQNGAVRALANKTLTLGQSNSYITAASPVAFLSPDGTKTITASMLNTDVLSFQGGAGQLLSISDSMTGTIFSVNDVSGIPSIEVLDTGVVKFAQYSGNVLIGTGTDSRLGKLQVAGHVVPTANLTYNLGSTTAWWNLVYGKSIQAQYADLAEHYVADDAYGPGTVVIFGGAAEITTSDVSHDTRVAGIISTDPAYLMNAANPGLPVALTGRVPCQVQGPVKKGDCLVNIRSGTAGRLDSTLYAPGCIFGKSLETIKDDSVKIIEVAVGRY